MRVEAAFRPEPQRRGFVYVDDAAERTITVIGDRMGPRGDDPLPWHELAAYDAVYFTAGDPDAVSGAGKIGPWSRPRGIETLGAARDELDAQVASAAA